MMEFNLSMALVSVVSAVEILVKATPDVKISEVRALTLPMTERFALFLEGMQRLEVALVAKDVPDILTALKLSLVVSRQTQEEVAGKEARVNRLLEVKAKSENKASTVAPPHLSFLRQLCGFWSVMRLANEKVLAAECLVIDPYCLDLLRTAMSSLSAFNQRLRTELVARGDRMELTEAPLSDYIPHQVNKESEEKKKKPL